MMEADVIAAVRQMRQLVMTLDSLGLPVEVIRGDPELVKLMPKGLPHRLVEAARDVHVLLQRIEKSKSYKDAVKLYCGVKERE